MERTLSTAEFIEHLEKANQTLERAREWEAREAARERDRQQLVATITGLHEEKVRLTESVEAHRQSVEEQVRRQAQAADRELEAYRLVVEGKKDELRTALATETQRIQSAIARAQADERSAIERTEAARVEWRAIKEALAKSYADVERLGALVRPHA